MRGTIAVGRKPGGTSKCLAIEFDGSSWADKDFPDVTGYLNSVWAHSSECIWVCGHTGSAPVLYMFDGDDWVDYSSEISAIDATVSLTEIQGSDTDNIYACGNNGKVYQYNGSSWSHVFTAPHSSVNYICVNSTNGKCYLHETNDWTASGYVYSDVTGSWAELIGNVRNTAYYRWREIENGNMMGVWRDTRGVPLYRQKEFTVNGTCVATWSPSVHPAIFTGLTKNADDFWCFQSGTDLVGNCVNRTLINYTGASTPWSQQVSSIAVNDTNDVWVCGTYDGAWSGGILSHFNGSTWSNPSDFNSNNVNAYQLNSISAHKLASVQAPNPPATTYDIQSSKKDNAAFYFVHIEGFPYLWTTDYGIASDWTPPTGFTLRPGLMLTPHDESASFVISKQMDVFSGVEDAESIDLTICDTLLHTLFATRKPPTTANSAQIVTNDIAAGSDADIEVESEITDAAASDGTIYIGNQTVTYSTKSGTTFSGVNRGRYAILDDNLDEVTWKPYTDWDDVMDIPLMVTTFPQRIEGRVMTVYRCYRHPDTGVPLAKAESQIRFRGKITAYGMQSTPNGYDIHATSIIAELENEIMAKSATCNLSGYALVNAALDDAQKYSTSQIVLSIKEEWWIFDDTAEASTGVFTAASGPNERDIAISSQYLFDDANALIDAINSALASAYSAGTLRAPWFCQRGQDGHVLLGHHAIGYGVDVGMDGMYVSTNPWDHSIEKIAVGETNVYDPGYVDTTYQYHLAAGVKGSVKATFVASAIGLGKPDGKWIAIGQNDADTYKHNFALYTNSSHSEYSTYLISDGEGGYYPYEPQQTLGEDEAAQAWFRLDYATRIPTDVTTDDGFIETIGDESPFLVKVGDKIIYRAATIEYVSKDVMLVDANYDYNNPIASARPPEDEYISVPESAMGEDVPTVRQVFMPSGLYEETGTIVWGGETINISNRWYGVNYTILQLMASTGTTDYNGDFDILPRGWGLGIPEQYIDVDSFKQMIYDYPYDALQRRWIFDRPMSFREFIEAEAKTLGFLVMVHEGKITAVPSDKLATNASAVMTIDNTVRIIGSEFSWRTAPEGIYNVVKLSLDYDYIEDKFYSHHEYHDLASQTDSRVVQAIEIENKGLASANFKGESDLAVDSIKPMMADRLKVYSKEVFEYTCMVNRKADGLKVGDIVYVTDSRIPNHLAGTVGISWHMGRVTRFEFDELDGAGEITVRLNYEFDRAIKVFTDISYWNSPQFSPSAQIESWVDDNTAIINKTLFNPDGFSDAQRILITDMGSGDQWSAGIESIDLTSGEVVFDTSMASARASSSELIMDFADFDDISSNSTDGSEFYSAIIGQRYYLG